MYPSDRLSKSSRHKQACLRECVSFAKLSNQPSLVEVVSVLQITFTTVHVPIAPISICRRQCYAICVAHQWNYALADEAYNDV